MPANTTELQLLTAHADRRPDVMALVRIDIIATFRTVPAMARVVLMQGRVEHAGSSGGTRFEWFVEFVAQMV